MNHSRPWQHWRGLHRSERDRVTPDSARGCLGCAFPPLAPQQKAETVAPHAGSRHRDHKAEPKRQATNKRAYCVVR